MKNIVWALLALFCVFIAHDSNAADKKAVLKKQKIEQNKSVKWHSDLNSALKEAQATQRQILLLATGSDWCPPCMNLEKKVLSHKDFAKLANENLVLLKADFPRRRAQSESEKSAAREIVKKYSVEGFPTVYLLTPDGKVLDKKVGFGGKSDPESYLKRFKGFKKK